MVSLDKGKLLNNRIIFGRICILAAIIALASVFDALIASYRKPANNIDIITGRSMEMVGKVYGKVTTDKDISFISDSPYLTISLDKNIFSGYWLGEDMWRGELRADSYLRPGKYNIKIQFNDTSMIKAEDREKVGKLSIYTVNVYSDAKALRESELSFIKRFTGISPWSIAVAFFPIVLISGGLIFIISGKIEDQMAQEGLAEIYRVLKNENGLEIFFGLGKKHGLQSGEKINLFNESGELLSEVIVKDIGNENSSAVTDILRIRPGFMVARIESF